MLNLVCMLKSRCMILLRNCCINHSESFFIPLSCSFLFLLDYCDICFFMTEWSIPLLFPIILLAILKSKVLLTVTCCKGRFHVNLMLVLAVSFNRFPSVFLVMLLCYTWAVGAEYPHSFSMKIYASISFLSASISCSSRGSYATFTNLSSEHSVKADQFLSS